MRKKSSVTSIDVARLAGVSQSAVSRAFSRVPTQSGVSDNLKKRIFAAAQELGYKPNALARSMTTGRSKIIADLQLSRQSVLCTGIGKAVPRPAKTRLSCDGVYDADHGRGRRGNGFRSAGIQGRRDHHRLGRAVLDLMPVLPRPEYSGGVVQQICDLNTGQFRDVR